MSDLIANLGRLVTKTDAGERVVYVGEEPYGFHTIYAPEAIRSRDGRSVFAEDDCGNWIAESDGSKEILFIDHETNVMIVLAKDFEALISSLTKLREADVAEPKVISSWLDPDFARSLKGENSQ